MQKISNLLPSHLPARLKHYHHHFEHHLMLKMSGPGVEEVRRYLTDYFQQADSEFFACTPDEAAKAFLYRFAVADAAVCYHAVHQQEVEDILSLDIALRRIGIGLNGYRQNLMTRWFIVFITATSFATFFIRIILCKRH